MKPILAILTFILAFHSAYSQDQETIYLPFPDLPQEILNPEKIANEILDTDIDKPQYTKSITNSSSETPGKIKPDKPTILNNTAKDSKPERNTNISRVKNTKTTKNSNQNKEPNTNTQTALNNQTSVNDQNNTKKESMAKLSEPILELDKSPKTSDRVSGKKEEMEILTPEDREKFQKSMEEIRRNEKNDPESSIEKYKKLNTQYSQPELRSKVLISIAWNYFHRQKNLECLDTLLMILENKDFILFPEYPTAMYLAARVHDRPWAGQNKNFTSRYHEIFQKNIDAGRENFQNSHYRNLIEKN
jgi:hypothetical protein